MDIPCTGGSEKEKEKKKKKREQMHIKGKSEPETIPCGQTRCPLTASCCVMGRDRLHGKHFCAPTKSDCGTAFPAASTPYPQRQLGCEGNWPAYSLGMRGFPACSRQPRKLTVDIAATAVGITK